MNVGRHLERLHMTKIQPGADPKVAFRRAEARAARTGVNRAPVLKAVGGRRCGFNTRRVSVPQGGSTLTSTTGARSITSRCHSGHVTNFRRSPPVLTVAVYKLSARFAFVAVRSRCRNGAR
jgi:hypothetical protein